MTLFQDVKDDFFWPILWMWMKENGQDKMLMMRCILALYDVIEVESYFKVDYAYAKYPTNTDLFH